MSRVRKWPRFTIWTDETTYSAAAIESGLKYGVYDSETNEKALVPEEYGVIKSYGRAKEVASAMNSKLANPYKY